MSAYASKYNFGLNGEGYVISKNRKGVRYYQKKKAPSFVNKYGGGDAAYRDATFWQYFVQTNWRNGSKQLKFDDPGRFWKSSDVDTTILEELTLSRSWASAGQMASGIKVNVMEAWRSSQSWWDGNYSYRQQLTITAPAGNQVPVGYPVKLTVDTAALVTASKMRSDRKDLRIVYYNGSSLVDISRDYISGSETFFGAQAAIAAGTSDNNYYLYYGYSSESTSKQPTTEDEWNSVYGMYGTTADAYSKMIYHMVEGSGTSLADHSTRSNNGTIGGSPTWTTGGKFGRYLNFNGAGQGVMCGNTSDFNFGSFTLEAWVKAQSGVGMKRLFVRKKGINHDDAYAFEQDFGGYIRGRTDGTVINSQSWTNGTWYHVAMTCNGTNNVKLWVNGSVVKSGSVGATFTSYQNLILANNGEGTLPSGTVLSSSQMWKGGLQHVRASNIERTSFPYVLASEPVVSAAAETTTSPPASSFDLYGGGSDGKVYLWDGDTTWTEQFDTSAITWYSDTDTQDADELVGDEGGTEKAKSQGFQLADTQTVGAISVYIKKNAGTPGDITVRIETDSSSKPSGTLADADAEATIPAFTDTDYGWVNVEFTDPFALSGSTQYHLVLKTAAASNDNNYAWGADASSPSYSDGAQSYSTNGGSTWTADSTKDQLFKVHGQSTSVNCMLISSLGGNQKLYIGTGDPDGETNGDARLYAYDGTDWSLAYTFDAATESVINSMTEYSAASKAYIGVGPQARIYSTDDFSTFTEAKDINVPQNPGYTYAMKEYNRVLHVGGGSPEFLPGQHYNGFLNIYDTTAWNILYPFDFTVIKSLEFYDAYLFMGTYHGHLYVYDTSSLNPIFNYKDQYDYRQSVYTMKYFDDKLYIGLYPQDNSNDTNAAIWLFDRRGLTQAHTIDGVTGYRCFAVVNGTLLVGTGDDGYVYKLEEDAYKSSGWYQSSYFDANLPSIDKLYNSVTIRHDPLLEGQTITVYYKFKESDDWTELGISNTAGDIEKVLSFPTGVYSKKISLKVELAVNDTSATPKLTETIMQYSLYPQRKFQWTIRIKAKDKLRLLDGTLETRTPDQIRADIEELFANQQLYSYVDVDGSQHSVLMNDLDTQSWVINSEDLNEEEVAITLLEA